MALLRGLVDLLYPPACQVCKSPGVHPLCEPCLERFPLIRPPFCQQCGKPLRGPPDLVFTCVPCRRHRWYFGCARAAGVYDGGLREAIHALKFGRCTALAQPLGALLAQLAGSDVRLRAELVVPVPLHPARLRARGFNQSVLLATEMGRRLGIPVDIERLRRTRATVSQTGLTADGRRTNVRGAFTAVSDRRPVRVLLVDDVMATGSTVRECAKVLRGAGAREVTVAVLASAVFR